jgi:hypothetical protein
MLAVGASLSSMQTSIAFLARNNEGIRVLQSETIMIEEGWASARTPLHAGPYVRVSRDGKILRIPLASNPSPR